MKIKKKKFHFGGRNNIIWLNNEEPPTKSCSFNHLQLKSYINLCKSEFWHKIKRARKQKFLKKFNFGGQTCGTWPKNDELWRRLARWPFSNRKATQICVNLNSSAKKKHRNKKFSKNVISEAETMEFDQKKMNLLQSLDHWPISNRKAAQIFANMNFGSN